MLEKLEERLVWACDDAFNEAAARCGIAQFEEGSGRHVDSGRNLYLRDNAVDALEVAGIAQELAARSQCGDIESRAMRIDHRLGQLLLTPLVALAQGHEKAVCDNPE